MLSLKTVSSPRLTTLILGGLALLLVIYIILFPDEAFQSSLQGLSIWWKLVFPALLPFLILTEILRGMGVLHGLGALLEPLLRMLFRLPGVGGWILALGLTAGAPSGAIAVGQLRRDKLVTRDEAERLLALSHLLSPVFLITIVGVGFLHDAKSGLALAVIHYASALLVAFIERFTYVRRIAERQVVLNRRAAAHAVPRDGLFVKSAAALRAAQAADGRTFGKLLGDSVSHSVQQLMAVGGLIMIFSVVIHVVTLSGFLSSAAQVLAVFGLGAAAQTQEQLAAITPGLLEVHLGAYAVSQNNVFSHAWQYALLSAVFAWGGLATHAQVQSFTLNTDIRYSAFLRSRLLLSIIASVATLLCWNRLYDWIAQVDTPAWLTVSAQASANWTWQNENLWPLLSPLMLWFSGILLLMLTLSVFIAFFFRDNNRGHSSEL
ncbi:nucleoside recognition domain-containing protein [Paenibacillus xerothermodurans]|uniref:Sporulation protein n=1 Tax=Paenibacillus xerothermodurans TaxID=1977292 RepID=A0A2W1P5V7_PAEXE|nr:nucleoside recognition domain-containing protein [Paenibacillus xerothermodurans]PZE22498.1 sporulation protein [Paenibacillus xerothermodurans]